MANPKHPSLTCQFGTSTAEQKSGVRNVKCDITAPSSPEPARAWNEDPAEMADVVVGFFHEPPAPEPAQTPEPAAPGLCQDWGKHFCQDRLGQDGYPTWRLVGCVPKPRVTSTVTLEPAGPGQPQADKDNLGKNTNFSSAPSLPALTGLSGPGAQPPENPTDTEDATGPLEQLLGYSDAFIAQGYEQLYHLRQLSSLERLRNCGMWVSGEYAQLRMNGRGRARWVNLCVCGLRWQCPVCAPHKAAQERRRLMTSLCKVMLCTPAEDFPPPIEPGEFDDQPKYGLIFLTATVPHYYTDKLKDTLDLVVKSWSFGTGHGSQGFLGGRKTWTDLFGVEGYARCLDLTVGNNGWHPHIHAAVVVRTDRIRALGPGQDTVGGPELSAEDLFLKWFEAWFYRRWNEHVKKVLGLPEHAIGCSLRHGVRLEWAKSPADVARYVQKEALGMGFELTEGHRKGQHDDDLVGGLASKNERAGSRELWQQGHRSPFGLLANLCELDRLRVLGQSVEIYPEEEDEWQELLDEFKSELELWHEYEEGMQGRSALRTSKGFWSHPDFGVKHMSVEEQYEFLAESVAPDARKEREEPDNLIEVVPWLFTWLVRVNLDGWCKRLAEQRWREQQAGKVGGGCKAFDVVKDYCDSVKYETRPPPGFCRATLDDLVDEAQAARKKG